MLNVFIVVLVKAFSGDYSTSGSNYRENPLEILKAHHAHGKIDEEEFKRQCSELEK